MAFRLVNDENLTLLLVSVDTLPILYASLVLSTLRGSASLTEQLSLQKSFPLIFSRVLLH